MAKKAFVALSGGVDSTVAAYLLLREGYDVAGVTMNVRKGNDVAEGAAEVARTLSIEHYVFDFSEEFERLVIEPFANEYLSGRTPNPCVLCNAGIKWGALLQKSIELGADLFATGHYANIVSINGRYSLRKADFAPKDQTYALYGLTQAQLEKTRFPLGEYQKDGVRRIAREAGFGVSDKPDSQEICFVEDNNYAGFIREYSGVKEQKGEFTLANGTVLGVHNGISNYTIGQRKGLGISYSEPLFVLKLDTQRNRVILGSDAELYTREFTAGNVNYMSVSEITEETECYAKIRYAHKGALCVIEPVPGCPERLLCCFDEPQRAITPGQSAVFYDKYGTVIAGGVIL